MCHSPEAVRRLILQAALEEFASAGVAQSLERIASRAKLDVRAVRALFIDEKTLLLAVLKELTEPLVSAISVAVHDADDPAELIRRSFKILDDWLITNPKYVRISLQCMLADPSILMTLFQHSLYPSEFVEQLESYVAEGRITQKDVVMVLVFFDSLIFFPHLTGSFLAPDGGRSSPADFLERRTQAVMDLFQGGLFDSP
jgi:AcrR family transcriptional regulator